MKMDYVRHQSARMFETPVLETFSRVHPATPFVFYIPLVSALFIWGLYTGVTSWLYSLVFIPLGFLTWEFMEYFIHRHFFHWEGNSPFTRRLHDIVHGYHHKYPDDAQRLVMPLGASLPMALLIGGGLYFLKAPAATLPYFLGIVGGYLWYDFMHWSTHYRTPLTGWGRGLRSHHMSHHFADPNTNFGISHRWIDVVMGTMRRRSS